jgi:hypothetical protein
VIVLGIVMVSRVEEENLEPLQLQPRGSLLRFAADRLTPRSILLLQQ